MLFPFCVTTSQVDSFTVNYQNINIPRNALGRDWNFSPTWFGPRSDFRDRWRRKYNEKIFYNSIDYEYFSLLFHIGGKSATIKSFCLIYQGIYMTLSECLCFSFEDIVTISWMKLWNIQ